MPVTCTSPLSCCSKRYQPAGAENCKRAAGFLAFLTLSTKALQASSQLLDAIRKRNRSDAANLPWFPDRMSFSRIFLRFPAFSCIFPAFFLHFPAFFLHFPLPIMAGGNHPPLSGGVGSKGLIQQRGDWRIRQSGAKCSGSRLAFFCLNSATPATHTSPPPPLYGRNLCDWTPFPFAFFPLSISCQLFSPWLFHGFRPPKQD